MKTERHDHLIRSISHLPSKPQNASLGCMSDANTATTEYKNTQLNSRCFVPESLQNLPSRDSATGIISEHT